MSEGSTRTRKSGNANGASDGILSVDDLANRSQFQFNEVKVDLPELGAGEGQGIVLRSLSVEQREQLPDLTLIRETDDKGERTAAAIKAAAETFSLVVVQPKVTAERAEEFLGSWPTVCWDRVNAEYAKLVGGVEEERAAYGQFPGENSA